MTEALEKQQCRSEAQWWNAPRSLGDIAEHLERTVKDKQSLERKVNELLEENNRLASRCAQVDAELAKRTGLRHQAEFAVRERLLRDEFERRIQELRLLMKQERRQLVESVEKLEEELAGCFCRQDPNRERVVHVKGRPDPRVPVKPGHRKA